MRNKTIQTSTALATEEVGEMIGKHLQGGEVIELVSDLGGGKTTLVRGLARGFGSPDKVASPTYTISKVYKHGSRELHHFDFYRLQEAGLISHELTEVIEDPACTVVFEWGEVVQNVLPAERLTVIITKTGEEMRKLEFRYPDNLAYLTEGITDK
jgi:tRNA threonylcarbamoyladenosine biosynthesis protein TsaE